MSTEDRWTPPSEWCPDPHWWHSDPDEPDVTEYEVTSLALAFVIALQPAVVVETGTSTGATALALAGALQANGHGHLWTVEIDPGLAARAAALLADFPATVVCQDSLQWAPPSPIDFAWIDSGTAQHRIEEFIRWRGLFRSGAVVGVHDTAPNMGRERLGNGLDGVLDDLKWPRLRLRTPRGVTFVQVP